MPKFRKKPVVIEAEPYRPGLEDGFRRHPISHAATGNLPDVPFISTLEGDMVIWPGDWVITGIKGKRYPIRSDIFEATYEAVD